MGAFLEKPIVEKHVETGTLSDGSLYALSSMQGWRIHMEDAHTLVPSIPGFAEASFFAVFDGHGGKTVSISAGEKVLEAILNTPSYKDGAKTPEELADALKQGLLDLDEQIKNAHPQLKAGHDRSGSTAVLSFLTKEHFVIANCGDSRIVVCTSNDVRFGSMDHKPDDAEERNRIKAAGGFIEMGRVCGNLAVSRSLGDYEYKDRPDLGPEAQKVTVASDTTVLERKPEDEFVILACDGIWDVMSNEGAVVFVNFYLERGWSAERIASEMLDYCLRKGSRDNMSVILILLPNHRKADPTLAAQLPEAESQEEIANRTSDEHKALDAAIAKVPGVPMPVMASDPPPLAARPPAAATPEDTDEVSTDEASMDTAHPVSPLRPV
eukprot:m.222889 g.222889  ORF g.222889 m.222889 type:complete len:381 (-) comp17258_c0_seq2:2382-3524(-)